MLHRVTTTPVEHKQNLLEKPSEQYENTGDATNSSRKLTEKKKRESCKNVFTKAQFQDIDLYRL